MNNSALGRKQGRHDAKIERRVNLIAMVDEEFNVLLACDPLPVEKLEELAKRCEAEGLIYTASRIRKELPDGTQTHRTGE